MSKEMDLHDLNMESHSKFLSLILRHKPEQIGLELDGAGWALVDELVTRANNAGRPLDRKTIEAIVASSDKQRFALSEDGLRIRANQGHSIDISLGLEPVTPPKLLYHGTAIRFLESIRADGLHAAQRQHVHLSSDASVAAQVGARHGKAVVLRIDSEEMSRNGHLFYLSKNGVWLTERVPATYIHETAE